MTFATELARLAGAADGGSMPGESAADAALQRYLANQRREILVLVDAARAVVVNETDGEPYTPDAIESLSDALTALDRSNGEKEKK